MTTPTNNNIPSSTAIDVRFNTEKLDEVVNSDNETYLDRFGNSRFTLKGLAELSQAFYNGLSEIDGFRLVGGAESFSVLRSTPVRANGQRILLKSWWADTDLGGGEFVGYVGTKTDDGGVIAAGDGYYWERVDKSNIDLTMFGAIPKTTKSDFDSVTYIQKAINYAIAAQLSALYVKGKYNLFSSTTTFALPGDDGTVYPGWVGNGDVNLSPEPIYTQPVCLVINGTLSLQGQDPNRDGFVGNWNALSSPIDINQNIGLLITAGSKYKGTIRYKLIDLSFESFFIARVVEGTSEQTYEQLKFSGCGIAGLKQGIERHIEGTMDYGNGLTGDVHGGWWTQRNDSNNNPYLPPYPATDVWSLGWTDFCMTDFISYGQQDTAYGARHLALDEYFNIYFYKSQNSAKTSAGGRLSNNTGGTPAKTSPYRGIVGRARTVYSRYGRACASYKIGSVKVLGPHRTPLFFNNENGIANMSVWCEHFYAEGIGMVQRSLGINAANNQFGIGMKDPYRDEGYGIGYLAGQGWSVNNVVLSSNCQVAAYCEGANPITNSLNLAMVNIDKGAKQTRDPFYISIFDSINGYRRIVAINEKRALLPAGAVGTQEDFVYATGITFVPTLTVGTVTYTPTGKVGIGKLIGKIFFFNIEFFVDGAVTYPAGNVVLGGLPFSLKTGPATIKMINVEQALGYTGTTTLKADISGTNITLKEGWRGANLSGATLNTTSGHADYVFFKLSGYYEVP